MKILINGNEIEIDESSNLRELLKSKKISTESAIVELNGRVLSSKEIDIETRLLKEGDCLEVMALVGGG